MINFKLSVVIPCFNEGGNILKMMNRIDEVVRTETNIEFILVDNGSQDHSHELFLQEMSKRPAGKIKYLKLEKNKGYGGGILAGLEVAEGDILAWTHADMQTDPKDLIHGLKFFNQTLNQKIMVKGKRIKRDLFSRLFTLGMQTYANLLLQTSLSDINAQPKMFSKNFYTEFLKDKSPEDFSLDLFALFTAQKNGFEILDFPVLFKDRTSGEAKGAGANSLSGKWKLMKRTFNYINKLKSVSGR